MILRIALFSVPLRKTFDYLPNPETDVSKLQPGIRVRVPFGRQKKIGILLEIAETSDFDPEKLKSILEILDQKPLLPKTLHNLLLQAASYYQHPVGDSYETALPVLLREGKPAAPKAETNWKLDSTENKTESFAEILESLPKNAVRQRELLQFLQLHPDGVVGKQLTDQIANWRTAMQALEKKGLVTKFTKTDTTATTTETTAQTPIHTNTNTTENLLPPPSKSPYTLNEHQQYAVDAICKKLGKFAPFLLYGITGSGKTEVYLQAIAQIIAAGKQALVLVPEISLTPQTVARFEERFAVPVLQFHSNLTAPQRLNHWLRARSGEAKILIGTRSAIFAPMRNPGILIVDEEHDSSFKQQDGFRYSARDLAVWRGQQEKIPVILGSATPALESLHNAQQEKYQLLHLPERAGTAKPPTFELIDLRARRPKNLLSTPLVELIRTHLEQQSQVLLFLNRRGYAPVLLCRACGWTSICSRCDLPFTLHRSRNRLICHHCGNEKPAPQTCPQCGNSEMRPIGSGTERVEEALLEQFPDVALSRIDRDTTQRKHAMLAHLEEIHDGQPRILLGTQMLAKGHHFPKVTLAAILDADGGLFSADFRATEQMSQLIIQVAGRAGRAEKPGTVALQTYNPDHPLLQTLLAHGYDAFTQQLLAERKEAQLPPFSHLVLFRAEANQPKTALQFLEEIRTLAAETNHPHEANSIEILGPIPAPIEKRAGRYRAQLLLQSHNRTLLKQKLAAWLPKLETMKTGKKVRWSVDVDPSEML